MRPCYCAAAVAFLFAASAHADDKAACIAASEQAQKLVDDRRLLDARKKFLECAQESCPAAIRSDCAAQVEDLKKTIPTLIFRVKGDSGDVTQAHVALDGTEIVTRLDGQAIEVDPGTHKVKVTLDGGRSLDQQVVVAMGERNRTVVFDSSAKVASAPATDVKVETHWSTLRAVGFASMIVGGTGVLVGVVSQLLAFTFQSNATTLESRASNAGSFCQFNMPTPTGNVDCDNAISYHQQALTTQTVALASLIGGGVLLIGGAILYVVGGNVQSAAKSALSVMPLIGPGVAGVGLSSTF